MRKHYRKNCMCGFDDCERCFPQPRRDRELMDDCYDEQPDDYAADLAARVYEAELNREPEE